MLEKTLESPLHCKEIKPVNPEGNRPWIFIGRTDAEAVIPALWPPDTKKWLNGKDPDAGKDWRQEEKGTTEDKMLGWHHWLNGHEFEQALRVDYRQGSPACCSPWGCKMSDTTEWLNWYLKMKNLKKWNGNFIQRYFRWISRILMGKQDGNALSWTERQLICLYIAMEIPFRFIISSVDIQLGIN